MTFAEGLMNVLMVTMGLCLVVAVGLLVVQFREARREGNVRRR